MVQSVSERIAKRRRPRKKARRSDGLDRRELLERLEPIEYTGGTATSKDEFEKLKLVDTLLMLADISHETEYELCGEVARHLLGERPEPNADEDEFA